MCHRASVKSRSMDKNGNPSNAFLQIRSEASIEQTKILHSKEKRKKGKMTKSTYLSANSFFISKLEWKIFHWFTFQTKRFILFSAFNLKFVRNFFFHFPELLTVLNNFCSF